MNEKQPPSKNTITNSEIHSGRDTHIGDVVYKNTYIQGQSVTIPHLLTNNIPTNAEYILGRDTELQTITTHLSQNKPTVLVNGLGGIGKTSVAAKYVATHGHEYKHLAWITVQSTLAEAFTNNAPLLASLQIKLHVKDSS